MQPPPADDDLQQPPHLTPRLVVLDRAGSEFEDIGLAYWSWLGMRDKSFGGEPSWTSVWAASTQEIADRFNETAGRLYLIAAASVEAQLTDVECSRCHAPVALKSRTALDELARGTEPESCCGRCSPRIQGEVAKLLDPAKREARTLRKEQVLQQRAAEEQRREQDRRVSEAAQQLRRERREALNRLYPVAQQQWEAIEWDHLRVRLRVETATLAILDHAPHNAPIPATVTWEKPLGPNSEAERHAVVGAFRAGMISIHPDSRFDAFVWSEEDPSEPTTSFYPSHTDWYVSHGPSMPLAADALRSHVRERIGDWLRTEQGVTDVADLAHELIVAETVRYLDYQLGDLNLPPVPENHRPRLIESAARLASEHSLGQCYSVAWRAAHNGAAMSKRHPYAPEVNASTHAVNTFETMVTDATTNPATELRVYRADTRSPVSALTTSLMVTVLQVDPMAASVPAIEAALRSAPEFPTSFALTTRDLLDQHDPDVDPNGGADDIPDGGADWNDPAWNDPANEGPDATETPESRAHSPAELGRLLADGLLRLKEKQTTDVTLIDQFLIAGREPIVVAYGADEAGSRAIDDALERLTTLRVALTESSDEEVLRNMLAFAFLHPGSVSTRQGDLVPLGQAMGFELLRALGLGGDF